MSEHGLMLTRNVLLLADDIFIFKLVVNLLKGGST